jgi:hypothetical protein
MFLLDNDDYTPQTLPIRRLQILEVVIVLAVIQLNLTLAKIDDGGIGNNG